MSDLHNNIGYYGTAPGFAAVDKKIRDEEHAEMVATWVAESIQCDECAGEGCAACGDLGRIALCDTGQEDLSQEQRVEQAELDADASDLEGPNDVFEDCLAAFRAEY